MVPFLPLPLPFLRLTSRQGEVRIRAGCTKTISSHLLGRMPGRTRMCGLRGLRLRQTRHGRH